MAKTETPLNEKHALHKKAYIKPMFSTVQLVPEEAVLGNCKEGTGTFGAKSTCEQQGDLLCSSVPRS